MLNNNYLRTALLQFRSILDGLPSRAFNSSDRIAKRNALFTQEQKHQFEDVGRIEKINVIVRAPPEDTTLVMNKNISTPYDCAKHISESILHRAALAQVDETYWDLHSPIPHDCTLRFLGFKDSDPSFVNRTFWRSCSVLLGAVISSAFKDDIPVYLHSFPSPNVRSGSFVYDVSLGLSDWAPTKDELRVLSAEMAVLSHKALPFERLVVSEELASEIFEGNQFKQEQIPNIAEKSPDGKVTLYRVGEHIEVSRGPLIADTSFLGRCTIAAVHPIEAASQKLYRFQGVALPKGIMLNHFAYGILEERAAKLNPARVPGTQNEEYEAQIAQ